MGASPGVEPMKNMSGDNHEHYYEDELVTRKLRYLTAGPARPPVVLPPGEMEPFSHPATDPDDPVAEKPVNSFKQQLFGALQRYDQKKGEPPVDKEEAQD